MKPTDIDQIATALEGTALTLTGWSEREVQLKPQTAHGALMAISKQMAEVAQKLRAMVPVTPAALADAEMAETRARHAEAIEAYSQHYNPRGFFGNPYLVIDNRSFGFSWSVEEDTAEADAQHREWFGIMVCAALKTLVEEHQPSARLSENTLYYLRAIARRMDEFHSALDGIEGLTLGGEAFADERDWLSDFIEAQERQGDSDA